jgi:hypothetical protein
MLTPEMKILLQRTLPIDHIDTDRIVLRGPVNRGADIAVVASAFNPACIAFYVLLIGVLLRGPAIGEDLADAPSYAVPLIVMILISVLATVAVIILAQRRRTLRIALHRGQYLAHFYGPKGIDICLPLAHPFLVASATGRGGFWKSPDDYKNRPNRTQWERLTRFWPMGRIPTLNLCFPEPTWMVIVPRPGAREADFIACWEWLLQFIVPARASTSPTPPGRVLRLAGAVNMLTQMSLHSFTDEKLGLFWTTNAGGLLRSLAAAFTSIGGLFMFVAPLGPFAGRIPFWVAIASCLVSTASAILLSLRIYPTVTTFTRGQDGAYLERRRGCERIPEFRIGLKPFENLNQILMFTPRRTLRGRWMWIDDKPIADCALFIDQFCKPPVETEGVDVDV